MEETQRLEEESLRGEQADKLLNNPILRGWFTARKAALFESFTQTKAKDDDTRQLIWLKMQVITELESDLLRQIESGKMAKSTLKEFIRTLRGKR